MRLPIKLLVEGVARRAAPAWIRAGGLRGRGVILAYHNVIRDGSTPVGDLPLHIGQQELRQHLGELKAHFDVVPLDRMLEPSRSQRPRAAITFDDAYLGALTHGWEVVREFGMPATVFVTPGFIGGKTFWWDALASPSDGLDPAIREHVLLHLEGRDDQARRWAAGRGGTVRDLPAEYAVASMSQLKEAASQGLRLGAHTWSHPALTRINAEALTDELRRPLEWLREHFAAATTPWLAYPFGLTSPAVEAAALAAGYRGAVLVDGGTFTPPSRSPGAFPRLTIPGRLTVGGFHLRLLGLRR